MCSIDRIHYQQFLFEVETSAFAVSGMLYCAYDATVGVVTSCQSAVIQNTLQRKLILNACVFCVGNCSNQFLYRAHSRNRANTTEPSVCGGNAVLCQITLATCYYILRES